MNRLDGDEMNYDDDDPQGRRKMRTRKSNQKGGGGEVEVKDIFNDWDLLLPSKDPYKNDYDYDDQDLYEDGRRKKRRLSKKGWESAKGQTILLTILVIHRCFCQDLETRHPKRCRVSLLFILFFFVCLFCFLFSL